MIIALTVLLLTLNIPRLHIESSEVNHILEESFYLFFFFLPSSILLGLQIARVITYLICQLCIKLKRLLSTVHSTSQQVISKNLTVLDK